MNEKNQFVEAFKTKTKKFAIDALQLCDELPYNKNSTRIVANQLGRSASSTGANYRAACRARSDKEFYAKLSITIEEADESGFWCEVLEEGCFTTNSTETNRLKNEAIEITKVLAKARKNTTIK